MNNLIKLAVVAAVGSAAFVPVRALAICNDLDNCAPAPVVAAQDDSASGRGSGRIDPKLGYRGSGRIDPNDPASSRTSGR
jgi:hypothetical protein